MTKEEQIKDWFIHQFWPAYPGKWCRSGKGGRGEAMNAFLKKKPTADSEELSRILGNLKAQIRADKGKSDRKWWVIGKTYCNNESWEDPVEDDLDQEVGKKYCQCGEPVAIAPYGLCIECYRKITENREIVKKTLKAIGLYRQGQSLREVSQNCREHTLGSAKSGNLFEKTASSLKPADSGNQ